MMDCWIKQVCIDRVTESLREFMKHNRSDSRSLASPRPQKAFTYVRIVSSKLVLLMS